MSMMLFKASYETIPKLLKRIKDTEIYEKTFNSKSGSKSNENNIELTINPLVKNTQIQIVPTLWRLYCLVSHARKHNTESQATERKKKCYVVVSVVFGV